MRWVHEKTIWPCKNSLLMWGESWGIAESKNQQKNSRNLESFACYRCKEEFTSHRQLTSNKKGNNRKKPYHFDQWKNQRKAKVRYWTPKDVWERLPAPTAGRFPSCRLRCMGDDVRSSKLRSIFFSFFFWRKVRFKRYWNKERKKERKKEKRNERKKSEMKEIKTKWKKEKQNERKKDEMKERKTKWKKEKRNERKKNEMKERKT